MSAAGRRVSGVLFATLSLGCVVPITSTPNPDAGVAGPLGGPGAPDAAIPTGTWINVTGNLAGVPAACGNLTTVSAKPDEDLLIAGVANNGLWASADGGSWQILGGATDASAPIVNNRPTAIVYDPANHTRFWESGSYGPGVYETTDDGNTFVQLGSAGQCEGLGVDFSDRKRQTIVAGAHETPLTLYWSTNGGMTWTNVGASLPAGAFCNAPLVVNAQTALVGCYGVGIYRTTNAGSTWTQMTASGGAGLPYLASDKSIYWGKVNGGLTRSIDDGQTWSDIVSSTTVSGRLTELPDGRLADMAGPYVVTSSDHGITWIPVSSAVPSTGMESLGGVAYSAQQKAFYVSHNDCGGMVLSDAVLRYDFDYQTH